MGTSLSDRPLKRRLIKLGFSVVAGRRRAHWQDTFPGLKIDRENRHIRYFGQNAGDLSDSFLPKDIEDITIVGTGPSLLRQNVARLAPRSAILLNGAIRMSAQCPPMAIFVEDERFVWRHFDMLREAPADCPWFLSPSVIRALLEQDRAFLKDKNVMLIDNLLKAVHSPRRLRDDPLLANILDDQKLFSMKPSQGIMSVGTVAYTALQFAMAARPRRIGLAGIDLTNANLPRFYEASENAAPSGIVRGLDRIMQGFSAALGIAQRRGIALRCYSPVSALTSLGYPLDLGLEGVPVPDFPADAGSEIAL